MSKPLLSRRTSNLIALAVCLVAAVLFYSYFRGLSRFGMRDAAVTLVSRSPNGQSEIRLRELEAFIDRNFVLELVDRGTGTNNIIFRSPDEGVPGTERIVWSADGGRFVLLGRTFFVETNAYLPNGERLYVFYDLNSGRLRCNATQQIQYENFTTNEIAGIKLD